MSYMKKVKRPKKMKGMKRMKTMTKPGKTPGISAITKRKSSVRNIAAPKSPKANKPSAAFTTKPKGKSMFGTVNDGDKSGLSGAKDARKKRLLGVRI